MCGIKGKKPLRFCGSSALLRGVGMILIVAGALILLIFVPFRYWMALLGLGLLLVGAALKALF